MPDKVRMRLTPSQDNPVAMHVSIYEPAALPPVLLDELTRILGAEPADDVGAVLSGMLRGDTVEQTGAYVEALIIDYGFEVELV
jgi:hypothetical protein